jgi:hypothetical protein
LIISVIANTRVAMPNKAATHLRVVISDPACPAAKAGVEDGDVIAAYDGMVMANPLRYCEYAALADGFDLDAWRAAAVDPQHVHRPVPRMADNAVRKLVVVRRGKHIALTCPAHAFDGRWALLVPVAD